MKIGNDSVFGRINRYYTAVESNDRGALHLHGLLWLEGNIGLTSVLGNSGGVDAAASRERLVQYIDSVFTEVRVVSTPTKLYANINICDIGLGSRGVLYDTKDEVGDVRYFRVIAKP